METRDRFVVVGWATGLAAGGALLWCAGLEPRDSMNSIASIVAPGPLRVASARSMPLPWSVQSAPSNVHWAIYPVAAPAGPSLGEATTVIDNQDEPREKPRHLPPPPRSDKDDDSLRPLPEAPTALHSLPPLAPDALCAPMRRPPPRSAQMNVVEQQAAGLVRRGFALAQMGAMYSARSEFIQALRMLSQALDMQEQSSRHSQALADGLRALEEAEAFVPRGSHLEADLELSVLVAGHRTPVLKDLDPRMLSPLLAQQRYYTYAQEQLGIAAGHEPAGSMALHGLGKLHTVVAALRSPIVFAAESKAVVFQQAALLTDSRNYLAANELAVLLAKNGYFAAARNLLQQSLAGSSEPAVWHNLAVVHRCLGETELAALAQREGDVRTQQAASTRDTQRAIQWVDPKTFADTSRPPTEVQAARPRAESRKRKRLRVASSRRKLVASGENFRR